MLPAKNRNRREPYPEPDEKQVEGSEELVESPDGSISFAAVRVGDREFTRMAKPERKRQPLRWKVHEVYAGIPRTYYSYDELEQLRRAELKR